MITYIFGSIIVSVLSLILALSQGDARVAFLIAFLAPTAAIGVVIFVFLLMRPGSSGREGR